jgi:hypothetical protein
MSYVTAHYKKKKVPPNPIFVGCGGTIYLALLYALGYLLMTRLALPAFPAIRPEAVRKLLELPEIWTISAFDQTLNVPISNDVILWAEISVIVLVLLGFGMALYSIYYSAAREKEDWELYAEEAERQYRAAQQRRNP